MSDFTAFSLRINTGTLASATSATATGSVYTVVAGATTSTELRFSDVNTAGATASASWPFMTRPGVPTNVAYLYVQNASDSASLGCWGATSATPTAFLNANFNMARWDWDNVGTFASAPIFTAYASTAHAAITRGTPSGDILAGQTTDTGATQRSYLKGNAFGRVWSGGEPTAAAAAVPVITDGTTGSFVPTAGANWLANYQGLQGDNDFITFPSTPAAVTADQWPVMFALFTSLNMLTSTYTPVLSLKYTFV